MVIMVRFFIILSTMIYCLIVRAETVRIADPDDPLIRSAATSSSTEELTVTGGSSNGTSTSNAFKAYVCIGGDTYDSLDTEDFCRLNFPPVLDGSDLPTGTLRVRISYTNTSGDDRYISAAVSDEDAEDFDALNLYADNTLSSALSDTDRLVSDDESDGSYDIYLSLEEICDSNHAVCSAFSNSTREFFIYLYLDPDPTGTGDSVDVTDSDLDNGFYVNFFMSSKPPTQNPRLNELRPGDEQIFADYFGSYSSDDYFYGVRVCRSTTTFTVGVNRVYQDFKGNCTLDDELFAAENTAEIVVAGLENYTEYYLTLAYEDRFQFFSKWTDVESETPLEIQALADETSCFLVTATLGRDHYILDEFRTFRDQVLKQFSLGRKFIEFYYTYGRYAAQFVMEHSWLQTLLRPFVFFAYGILKLLQYWAGLLTAITFIVAGFYVRSTLSRTKRLQ